MSIITGVDPMPKPRRAGSGRPKGDRNDVPVKLDRAIVAKAKLLAAHRGTSLAAMLSEMLAAPVNAGYAAMLRELDGQR